MKIWFALALVATMLQHGSEPPKGWVCSNNTKTPKDHLCGCTLDCVLVNGQVEMKISKSCHSWCWEKDHCQCLHEGCDTHHH